MSMIGIKTIHAGRNVFKEIQKVQAIPVDYEFHDWFLSIFVSGIPVFLHHDIQPDTAYAELMDGRLVTLCKPKDVDVII